MFRYDSLCIFMKAEFNIKGIFTCWSLGKPNISKYKSNAFEGMENIQKVISWIYFSEKPNTEQK